MSVEQLFVSKECVANDKPVTRIASQFDIQLKTMAASNQSQTALSTGAQDALVSVIIPTYNRPAYLKEAIESAVGQTYQNIEIIVADDCGLASAENQKIVEAFQDPRIIFRRNATNLGVTQNFASAIKEARGKYIASLNDDDMWNKDFLEKLVPPLERDPDLALAFCDHYVIDETGAINYPETEKVSQACHRADLKEGVYQPFCKLAIVESAVAPACAAVIRKDVDDLVNIPSEVRNFYDLYLNYLCCRSGRSAYYCREKLTRYRVHSESYTQSYEKIKIEHNIRDAKAHIFCYERFMEDERLAELAPYFKERLAHEMTSIGINLLRAKKAAEARPYLWSALSQNASVRTIVAFILSFTPQSLASRF
jgi:glycosyltransferase domain-containing protein